MPTMNQDESSSVSESQLSTRGSGQKRFSILHPPSTICPEVIEGTQKASDLYNSGAKLWLGSDLARIEYELAHYHDMPSFTIRRLDGSTISVKNPMCGVSSPIWRPYVGFKHYWYLVMTGPPNEWLRSIHPYYSYFINWENQTVRDFTCVTDYPTLETQFTEVRRQWEQSQTCNWLKRKLAMLKGPRKITKVLCFGLGNLVRRTHYESDEDNDILSHMQKDAMAQHAAALTMADFFRSAAARDGDEVEIFAQDPGYHKLSRELLGKLGITVVGEHGARGFAKIDDECAVFFRYPSVPVRQIIADIARPAMIIGNVLFDVVNRDRFLQTIPFTSDAESPRTREMWKEYTSHDFEIVSSEMDDLNGLRDLKINVHDAVRRDSSPSGVRVEVESLSISPFVGPKEGN